MRILILCTGNSCRSQMAEAVLKQLNPQLEVFSAGTDPAGEVHPMAIEVMAETGIDISANFPKHINRFIDKEWDFVITVCDGANERCPHFSGTVTHRLHIGFEDPALTTGPTEERLKIFRRVRNEIYNRFEQLYQNRIKPVSNENS